MKNSTPLAWSIGGFYSRAWRLTKTHRELWILGLAFAVFAGGAQMNLNNSLDSLQKQENQSQKEYSQLLFSSQSQAQMEPAVVEDIGQFDNYEEFGMGEAAEFSVKNDVGQSREEYDWTPITTGFSNVPKTTYALLALELLVLFVGIFAIGLIANSWALGSLILGVAAADKKPDEKVNLTDCSLSALSRVKSLIWINLVPALAAILAFVVGLIIAGMAMTAVPKVGWISVVALALLAIYFFVRLGSALTWAQRHCLFEQLSGKEALRKGWATSAGTWWKFIRLSFSNLLVSGVLTTLLAIPFLALGAGPALYLFATNQFSLTNLPSLALAGSWFVFVLLALTIIMTGAAAVLSVFQMSTWHYAFKSVTAKDES